VRTDLLVSGAGGLLVYRENLDDGARGGIVFIKVGDELCGHRNDGVTLDRHVFVACIKSYERRSS